MQCVHLWTESVGGERAWGKITRGVVCRAWSLSHVRLFATPQTVAHQAPLSLGILQTRLQEVTGWPSCCSQGQIKRLGGKEEKGAGKIAVLNRSVVLDR